MFMSKKTVALGAIAALAAGAAAPVIAQQQINGSGASFPAPMLATWFESRGSLEVARRFIAKAGSAARRANKELWHVGRRGEAARGLLWRTVGSLDPKAAVVLARLVLGVGDSPSKRGE